ncbi:MAG: hypothetical protein V1809_04595 [Planctomycetota bacterium]
MRAGLKFLLVAGVLAGLAGLLRRPPDTMMLILAVFATAGLFRDRIAAAGRAAGPTPLLLAGTFLTAGTLTEILAWMDNYLRAAPSPALLHPQLFADLILGAGFYGGWALAWGLVLRRYSFRLREAFLVTGFLGIFFEQLGAVFLAMARALPVNPAAAVVLGGYVFLVYGSIAGLALMPALDRFAGAEKSRHWIRYPLVIAGMFVFAALGTWLAAGVAALFGGLPPKQPIREHPFW